MELAETAQEEFYLAVVYHIPRLCHHSFLQIIIVNHSYHDFLETFCSLVTSTPPSQMVFHYASSPSSSSFFLPVTQCHSPNNSYNFPAHFPAFHAGAGSIFKFLDLNLLLQACHFCFTRSHWNLPCSSPNFCSVLMNLSPCFY